LARIFILISGVIFSIVAIAKIISALGTQELLRQTDPLIGLSFRNLFLLAGWVELGIAASCILIDKNKFNALLIAWASTFFAAYRAGLWLLKWKRPCHCLGNLTDTLHISPQTADIVTKILLAYLFLGSYATLLWLWHQSQKARGRMQNHAVKIEPEVGGLKRDEVEK
jgi:hypothetical protein